ncbi:MAG: DUF6580 family putative transport protein [Saprospiraceae bacterium]
MENQKKSVLIITVLIIIAALSRLLPHPPNVTPIGATALFGAAYFTKKYWAILIPLIALWASDLILNNVFYAQYYDGFAWMTTGFLWIIGAFALIAVLGMVVLKNKVTPMNLLGTSFAASTIFFLITNFGSWMSGVMYPKTVEGLMACYTAGIPFFWNTLGGDLFYVTALFGAYELVKYSNRKLVMEH